MRGGVAVIAGGIALIVGALLPWMSLFIGLWPLRGVTGTNGYVFIVGGALAIAAGCALSVGASLRVRRAVGALGLGLLAFASWLMLRLGLAVHHIAVHDPMMFPRVGPGLFVVVLGAVTIGVAGFLPRHYGWQPRPGDGEPE